MNLLEEIRSAFDRVADPSRAEGAERFFKDQPIAMRGVPAPEIHRVARDFYPRVKKLSVVERDRLCTGLWASGRFEEGALVCYLYRRFAEQCGAREFVLFTRWLDRYVHNWGHTDGLALWLLGASIANDAALINRLDGWTRSKNRWKRRAAAVSLVYSAKRGEHTRVILRIAKPLIEDADDMVQKGIGWLLKETYPKRPKEVVRFLVANRPQTTRLVLRYAAEKMTAADRARVLAH
ncbi:MAG TPA: DNA alkylation repair protein [Bryobacteraceae bacterium]|nr:DNA alkylation repair protein [Bryobacteraceae bacterium]